MFLILLLIPLVASPCGTCELDEDPDDWSYCNVESAPDTDGTLYARCYKAQAIVVTLSFSANCADDQYYCDHHGRGCADDGGCLCPDLPSGETCLRFPVTTSSASRPSSDAGPTDSRTHYALLSMSVVFGIGWLSTVAAIIACWCKKRCPREADSVVFGEPGRDPVRTVDVVVDEIDDA